MNTGAAFNAPVADAGGSMLLLRTPSVLRLSRRIAAVLVAVEGWVVWLVKGKGNDSQARGALRIGAPLRFGFLYSATWPLLAFCSVYPDKSWTFRRVVQAKSEPA